MRSSKEIKKEIESRFGFFPPFFAPALKTPQILENLWQQTLSAYVENPLPALFKEKFAAIVARSCSVPYCLVCHSCTLRPLGMKAGAVLELLERWPTPSESEINESLGLLAGYNSEIGNWPEADSPVEDAILHISMQIFTGDNETQRYSNELRRVIGDANYAFLILFIGYNKTCLNWAEAHANELAFEADQRAKEHLGHLLEEEPQLGEFFKNYKEKFSNAARSKLAKQMSVESETKYKKIVQLSPAGIFQTDATGKFVFVSEGWQRVAGLSLEEAINAGWENAVHPDDKEKIFKEWMSSDAEKRTFKCEYRLRKPSGDISWVKAECEQLRNASGEITGYLGALQDITNLKDYEEKLVLAQSELERKVDERTADLRSLTESIPQLVWKIAPNGESLYMSPNWAELTGVPSDQAQWEDIIHPEDVPASKSAWLRCLETGSSYETEYRIKLKDGTYRWYLARGVPQLGIDGKIKRWFGTCTDIQNQKEAVIEKEALLEREVEARAVVETTLSQLSEFIKHCPLDVGMFDLNMNYVAVSDRWVEHYGLNDKSLIGKCHYDLFPNMPEHWKAIHCRALNGQVERSETDPYTAADGSQRWLRWEVRPWVDNSRKIAGVLVFSEDITERKRATDERNQYQVNASAALEASRLKSDFLANMSHEIRTPINGVIGMMGLLSDTRLLPEQREYADAARSSADALLTVINDILDFSKVEAGKLEFEDIDFDLLHLLKDVAKTFSFPARSKGITLSLDVDPKTPKFVGGDPGRLRQVLNNLLSNALKFTEKGQVAIHVKAESAKKHEYHLRVEIKDTGIGIPEKARSRMFQAFSQADASTTRRFGGTGLGLSICKHLVENMHGTIGVESAEGQGSTFWFTMSLRAAVAPVRNSAGRIGNFKDLSERHFRVLIAEDNTINQKIAVRVLEKMGLSADVVANGHEVLDAHRSIPYDLILMDCQMPELDGYETTRLIRASKSLPRTDIPIIAMTANAIRGDKEQCLSAGMNDYVSKPVKNDELFAVLSRWLLAEKGQPVVMDQEKSTDEVIDRAVIDDLLNLDDKGDRSLMAEVIGMWLAETPVALDQIRRALLSNDLSKIAADAHQLKSSSGNLGAMRVAKLSRQIECAALAAEVLKLKELIPDLEAAIQEAIPELQTLVGIPNTSAA